MAKSKEQPESGLPEEVTTVKVATAKIPPGKVSPGEVPSEKVAGKRTSSGEVPPGEIPPEKVPSGKVPPEPAHYEAGLSASALPLHRPPKPEDIAALARDCGAACIEALLDEVENGKGATRIAAARELLERGYGKPRQPLEVSGGVDVKQEVPEEIHLFLSKLGLERE